MHKFFRSQSLDFVIVFFLGVQQLKRSCKKSIALALQQKTTLQNKTTIKQTKKLTKIYGTNIERTG